MSLFFAYDLIQNKEIDYSKLNHQRTIILTIKDKTKIPNYIHEQYDKYASKYTVIIFDDNDCKQFLKREYGNKYVKKFEKINEGAHKAILFKYAYLSKYGGIYFDVKTILIRELKDVFKKTNVIYFTSTTYENMTLYNGIMYSPPNTNLFKDLLEDMMTYNNNWTYQRPNMNAITIIQRYMTKKLIYGYNKTNEKIPNIIMLEERFEDIKYCDNKRDWRGYCNFAVDKNDNKMIQIRDTNFKRNYMNQ
jgi:mannosyltransferase OCH1-like enzyme